MKKYLAVDYGSRRIGLALAQEDLDVVLPFGSIENSDQALHALRDIIQQEHITTVVIGLPVGLDGSENENTKTVRVFAQQLEALAPVTVDFENEMFTSQFGDRWHSGVSRDEKAAMIIMESYLKRKKL